LGLLVLADASHGGGERTAVYFYVSRQQDGGRRLCARWCHEGTCSSPANYIVKRVVGSGVAVLDGEALAMRP
jgi:hypothetical protein